MGRDNMGKYGRYKYFMDKVIFEIGFMGKFLIEMKWVLIMVYFSIVFNVFI